MRTFSKWLIAMGMLLACAATGMGQTNSPNSSGNGSGSPRRVAVPDAAAVGAATTQVEATYAEDLKNSTKPQDMVFLSQKLQLLAGDDRDDVHCYAMLAKAKDLAIQGGSFEQTASVIDLINERFDVDGPALKWDAVGQVARTAGKDRQAELLAGVVKLANDSMGVDRYDIALSAAQWCMDRSHGDVAVQALVDQVRETQSAYESIKPALATLASDPHNADANTAVGKFKCFFKGDWNGGLAMLAAGSDAALKGLASNELTGATGADAMEKLGDGWWNLAQQQSGIAKDKVQLHAAAIYAQASEGLAGLDKAKVDKRVQEAMALHAKLNGTTALATSPAPDSVSGTGPAPAPQTVVGPGPAHANGTEAKEGTNSVGMKLVWIKPGTFLMGSPEKEKGHEPDETRHKVTLTKGFLLAKTPVTVGQFALFMHDAGYKTDAEKQGWAWAKANSRGKWIKVNGASWRNPGFEQGDDHPVVDVSWNDSVAFCSWLSKKEGKPYRLPTEAEWEYSARGGTQTAYFFGSSANSLEEYAWVKSNSGNGTHALEAKKPNAWGLYDMTGSAWEWCADFYGAYPEGAVTDPTGPAEGTTRVVRGGAWPSGPEKCRCAYRGNADPTMRGNYMGFRVEMDAN